MVKELLKTIIADQKQFTWKNSFVERFLPGNFLNTSEIVIITGIRRCGKSTMIHQIRNAHQEKDYYLNFDDDRLIHFKIDDFQLLYETFIELFGIQKTFYFDEIQNIAGWERFIRRLHDQGNKIFITGSNATMLSREFGTHLTGRNLSYELFPFSFGEFLSYKGKRNADLDLYSTQGRSELKSFFNQYFQSGGFPVYLNNLDENYLKSLYENIIYRDVMVRNNLTNEREILILVNYLASNIGKLSSYNNLSKIIEVKNATTVSNYMQFIQDTYMMFQVNKHDYSLSKQVKNPKKIYFIDNAIVIKLGFLFTEENGRLLENLVFIELRRRGHEIYYYSGKSECDFLIREGLRVTAAIQVCYAFGSQDTKNREIKGLVEAMSTHHLTEGLLLTSDEEESIEKENLKIVVLPVWKWLLKGKG